MNTMKTKDMTPLSAAIQLHKKVCLNQISVKLREWFGLWVRVFVGKRKNENDEQTFFSKFSPNQYISLNAVIRISHVIPGV